MNNQNSWLPIIEFLDDQHESYMLQEQQPRRVDKIDLRVHACLYFIRPTGHTLKPLDIEVMKRLSSRVNLIPVVAKADTLSPNDLARFKQRVRALYQKHYVQWLTCIRFELSSKRKGSRSTSPQSRKTMKPPHTMPAHFLQPCLSQSSGPKRISRHTMVAWLRAVSTRGVLRKWKMKTIATSRSCDRFSSAHTCWT